MLASCCGRGNKTAPEEVAAEEPAVEAKAAPPPEPTTSANDSVPGQTRVQDLSTEAAAADAVPADPSPAGDMPTYKLTYFDLKGRGEVTRLLFHLGGVEFEDERIQFPDWPTLKPSTLFGGLPALYVDGVALWESIAIQRYVAKALGLYGKDDWEQAQCDQFVDALGSVAGPIIAMLFSVKDEDERKAQFDAIVDTKAMPFFATLEGVVAANAAGVLVGDKLLWCDVSFYNVAEQMQKQSHDVFATFPALTALIDKVKSEPKLQDYLASRA